ncbi:hypothetical protein C8N24_0219 [Solirubrobacter pauli]|uniref:Uncharacterized protein n=1 Tax=Solirubrobacter pauli TaxID=166793 RepID=A0A660L5Z9_9ACTN|nr:hypothetical protein [Solirubrobacter pauli]RKQ90417.1 hypothetical protein C8N24_0219 [Solirubrobacter pauli]
MLDRIAASDFRANDAFELILVDRLGADQRAALGLAEEDPDLYGVLLPRTPGPGRHPKAIDRDTALLYLTLRTPGRLPRYVHSLLGADLRPTVTRLVLDGVLEIDAGGRFVAGAEALALLAPPPEPANGDGRIAALSVAALHYGQRLELDDTTVLAGRLYSYNRLPLTPLWRRRLPTRAALAEQLGVAAGMPLTRTIGRRWTATRTTDNESPWLSWGAPPEHDHGDGTFKLYVSPQPDVLVDVLPDVVDVLAETRAAAFKVGADVDGVLRPDKLVAYFDRFERLAVAGERLRERLDGVPAHGVPFTAEIDPAGLLSWGTDPPAHAQTTGLQGHESWRLWLCVRLAAAVLSARAGAGGEPWRYALERIRLEGVDPATWAPTQAIWRQA